MSETEPRHLLHVFPTFAVGGAQARFVQLARLHGHRYRHSVIALDGITTMADRLPKDVAIECIPGRFAADNPLRGTALAFRLLKRAAPDVLISYNWGSMDWCIAQCMRRGIKHVHIEDGFGPEESDRQLPRRVWMRRLVLAQKNTITVVPSRRLETIALKTWKLPRNKVLYLPNGIDCTRFSSVERASGKTIVIGTVATLRREKNLARLIRIFALAAKRRALGSVKLLIVGDGPDREGLEQLARASTASEYIEFAGATAAPEKFLAEMDIFALTSDTEQMPFSVLEAAATGLPVISFNVGDLPFIVSPENAVHVSIDPTDQEAYVSALLALADDAELRRHLGACNRAFTLAQFDERTMATRYAALFG